MKLPVAASIAFAILVCIVPAVHAGGQVVDHDKVVEDPQLDYRKYSKAIAAGENAEQSHEAAALSATRASVGEDEAAFQASLAAEAQSLNAATPADSAPAPGAPSDASATPAAEAPHATSAGVWIALAIAVGVALVLALIALSSARRRKKSRRRQPEQPSVRLADFARKSDPDNTGK